MIFNLRHLPLNLRNHIYYLKLENLIPWVFGSFRDL
jgi:hypothetical protein